MFAKVLKYNPNHDPKTGRFTSGSGGKGSEYATFNRFEIEMSRDQVDSVPSQGAADAAVEVLAKDPAMRKQLERIGADKIRDELREYGAWDDDELADDEANIRRILWIGAGNVQEERTMGRSVDVGGDGSPKLTPSGHRPLSEIAREIRQEWSKQGKGVNYAAKPYLDAMRDLTDIKDKYFEDSGSSVVAYFLANANSFRGEKARDLKKELNAILKKIYKQEGKPPGFFHIF